MSLRRIGNVTINQVSPALETIASEFPTFVPNPGKGSGAFVRSASNPIITYGTGEDRIMPNAILEDPKRNRLLMICHARVTASPEGDNTNGRRLYLFSAPWGHPEGPWTRINPVATPLVAGTAAAWDANSCYSAGGCIVDDTLYISYVGYSGNYASANKTIGIAKADLTTAVPVATKVGQLQLGAGAPHGAFAPKLFFVDGIFHLWAHQQRNGSYLTPLIPRHWTNSGFATTGWTLDDSFSTFGDGADTTIDAAQDLTWLGGNRWWHIVLGAEVFVSHMLEIEPGKAVHWPAVSYIHAAGATYDTHVDEFHALFHQGQWYAFWGGSNTGGGLNVSVCMATWDGAAAPISQAGLTVTQRGIISGSTQGTFPLMRRPSLAMTSYATGGNADSNIPNWFKSVVGFSLRGLSSSAVNALFSPVIASGTSPTWTVSLKIKAFSDLVGTEVTAATNLGTMYYEVKGTI